jgi:hypothetical protein
MQRYQNKNILNPTFAEVFKEALERPPSNTEPSEVFLSPVPPDATLLKTQTCIQLTPFNHFKYGNKLHKNVHVTQKGAQRLSPTLSLTPP